MFKKSQNLGFGVFKDIWSMAGVIIKQGVEGFLQRTVFKLFLDLFVP